MSGTVRIYLVALLSLTMAVSLVGCNIFSWSSHDDTESLIDEGNRHMRDAEYRAAVDAFARAKARNPRDSEARYLHAKAVLHASGFNSLNLGTVMTDTDFEGEHPFPFTGPDWPESRADLLYKTMAMVRHDLDPIIAGKTTGRFDSADVDLDFALANAIEGTLLMRDINLDGKIDGGDFNFTFAYSDLTGMAITNIDEYLATLQPSGKLHPQGAAAGTIDSLITLFNNLLDSAEIVINRSRTVIEQILADEVGLNPEEIDQVLKDVIDMAVYFKINDPADNDGDGYVSKFGVGFDERINGRDDDGDDIIDEDSRYPWDDNDPWF